MIVCLGMCVHAREKSQRQLVMLVMFRARRGRSSTDTLIAGLAVADFFTSVFVVPFPKAEAIPDTSTAQFYCRVIYSGVIMWTARCASIFILTTISVERLTAVRYPFVFQRLFTPRQTMIAIHIIWITSFILNTLWIYVIFIEGNKCTLEFPSDPFQSFIGVSYFLIKYLFPVGIMVCAHTLTIRSLRKRAEVLRAGRKQRDLKLLEARRRVIETLIIVVVHLHHLLDTRPNCLLGQRSRAASQGLHLRRPGESIARTCLHQLCRESGHIRREE